MDGEETLITRNLLAGLLLASSLLCTFSAGAVDNSSPIGIDLVPPVQFPNSEFAIRGLRLSVVGLNREARGIDVALLGNITKQAFKGLAIAGLFNYNATSADIIGFQIAPTST